MFFFIFVGFLVFEIDFKLFEISIGYNRVRDKVISKCFLIEVSFKLILSDVFKREVGEGRRKRVVCSGGI